VFAAPLNGTADDQFSGVQTLPGGFTFNFFGAAQTDYIVSANGFLVFGNTAPTCATAGCRTNGIIPAAAQPNNIIAPYWDDLRDVKVCKKEEATKVTIQWTAAGSFESAGAGAMQVVLHTNGQIDLIYGSGHTLDGVSGTVVSRTPRVRGTSSRATRRGAFRRFVAEPDHVVAVCGLEPAERGDRAAPVPAGDRRAFCRRRRASRGA
jgi:hypothetical protein